MRHRLPHRSATVAAIGLALWCGSLFASGEATATISGANGRIAFVGDTAISVMSPNGAGVRRLTNSSGHEFPHWSPDGTRIAYGDGLGGIFTMSASGSGKKKLATIATTLPPGSILSLTWAPDGESIAFGWTSSNTDSPDGIYVVDAADTSVTRLTEGKDSSPAWSPDGTTIVFVRYDSAAGTRRIWTMDSDGGNEAPLTAEGTSYLSFLDWSPDGSKLVFERADGTGTQVAVVDSDGSDETVLTSSGSNSNPTWSPDGSRIGFVSSRRTGLWTMSPSGSGQARTGPANPFGMPDWQPVQVTLRPSAGIVSFGRSVTLRAHLVAHETSSVKEVAIYRIRPGGSEALVASGPVDGLGNLAVKTRPREHTRYVARWEGDDAHPAGGASDPELVRVRALVTGRLLGFFGKAGAYRLYHFTPSCPERGERCPRFESAVAPRHAGDRLRVRLQLRVGGRWRTVLVVTVRIPANGTNVVRFVYAGPAVIGVRTRARAEFGGDADHVGDVSPWAHFKVTR